MKIARRSYKTGDKLIKARISSVTSFLRRSKKAILLIMLVATATILATTIISIWLSRYHNLHLPSIGTIHTIGVKAYWDSTLQNETTEIQWGTIYLGTLNNVTLHIQSTSNVQTILELETAYWTFMDSTNMTVSGPSNTTEYMNLTWNYDNTPINPNETMQVTLTLHADNSLTFIQFLMNNKVNQFSFATIIRARPE